MKTATMNDHDLLIRLDAKVDQLSLDIKEVNDVTGIRVKRLEDKIVEYDKLVNETNPLSLLAMVVRHEKFINEFNLTKKLILAIVGAVGGVIGSAATLLVGALGIIR